LQHRFFYSLFRRGYKLRQIVAARQKLSQSPNFAAMADGIDQLPDGGAILAMLDRIAAGSLLTALVLEPVDLSQGSGRVCARFARRGVRVSMDWSLLHSSHKKI
jgi:hypothetical protein